MRTRLRLYCLAFAIAPALFGQANPNIFNNANRPTVPLQNPMDLAEQAARIRLMQEREREMAANREAMAKGRIEQNYRQGYEAGLKQGFDDGRDATLKDFRANFLMLEQTIIRKMANILFTTENPDEFRNMIAQNEQGLKEDPDDNVKKVLLILSRYRLAELVPPQAPATKKKKPKT